MILVDTSVWIHHLRTGDECLAKLLDEARILMHPFILGEIACGTLSRRAHVLGLLAQLPAAPVAEDLEVLGFVDRFHLHGKGLGWADVHLLASANLAGCMLWTRDKRLAQAASKLGSRHDEDH